MARGLPPSWNDFPSDGMAGVEGRHHPVMLAEVLAALAPVPSAVCADLTFGRGGHSRELLSRLGEGGRLYVVDRDPEALAEACSLAAVDSRVQVIDGPFSSAPDALRVKLGAARLDSVIMDLGVSSPQLDDPVRGFSFRADGPLDMRMDPRSGASAASWLAVAGEGEIADVLWRYGEERYARRIARSIVRERAESPIDTTARLGVIVRRSVPGRERGKDPATRTFQALRILVNDELEEVASCLEGVVPLLAASGRLAVISFHSLEDRIVKRTFRRLAKGDVPTPGMPWLEPAVLPVARLVGRARRPTEAEKVRNPRSRSGVLRVLEGLP